MSRIETFDTLSATLDTYSSHPASATTPEAIASRLLELAEARGAVGVAVRLRPDDTSDDVYHGRFALLGGESFEVLTTPELVDPVARVLIERSGARAGVRRPGRIEGTHGHFRVWAQPGGHGAEVYAWRRDREQEASMPSPSEAGFDAHLSDWLERRYLTFEDAHSRLLVVAAERLEETRGTVDLLLGLMDDPGLNGISAEEGGLSVRAPWLSQIACEGDLTLGGALRAALRQDPDVVVVRGPSALDHFEMLAQTAFTGHAVITTLVAPSAEAARERILALSASIGATPAFDVLFVRERREDGRVRLSGELRAGA